MGNQFDFGASVLPNQARSNSSQAYKSDSSSDSSHRTASHSVVTLEEGLEESSHAQNS